MFKGTPEEGKEQYIDKEIRNNRKGLGKDRNDLTKVKTKENKGISRSTVAARWLWCRTAGQRP